MGNTIFSKSEEDDVEKTTTISDIILILILIILIELIIGMLGYRVFNRNSWSDSFRNSSQVLTSVGENVIAIDIVGKIWSSIYALVTFFISVLIIGLLAGSIASGTNLIS